MYNHVLAVAGVDPKFGEANASEWAVAEVAANGSLRRSEVTKTEWLLCTAIERPESNKLVQRLLDATAALADFIKGPWQDAVHADLKELVELGTSGRVADLKKAAAEPPRAIALAPAPAAAPSTVGKTASSSSRAAGKPAAPMPPSKRRRHIS